MRLHLLRGRGRTDRDATTSSRLMQGSLTLKGAAACRTARVSRPRSKIMALPPNGPHALRLTSARRAWMAPRRAAAQIIELEGLHVRRGEDQPRARMRDRRSHVLQRYLAAAGPRTRTPLSSRPRRVAPLISAPEARCRAGPSSGRNAATCLKTSSGSLPMSFSTRGPGAPQSRTSHERHLAAPQRVRERRPRAAPQSGLRARNRGPAGGIAVPRRRNQELQRLRTVDGRAVDASPCDRRPPAVVLAQRSAPCASGRDSNTVRGRAPRRAVRAVSRSPLTSRASMSNSARAHSQDASRVRRRVPLRATGPRPACRDSGRRALAPPNNSRTNVARPPPAAA